MVSPASPVSPSHPPTSMENRLTTPWLQAVIMMRCVQPISQTGSLRYGLRLNAVVATLLKSLPL